MAKNEQADIPDRLRRLKKVAAPPDFEDLLRRQIRSRRSRNAYLQWFTRPVPLGLIVSGSALVIIVFFAIPHYFPSPPSASPRGIELSGQKATGNTQIAAPPGADSLSTDSTLVRKNDVNTSKMP